MTKIYSTDFYNRCKRIGVGPIGRENYFHNRLRLAIKQNGAKQQSKKRKYHCLKTLGHILSIKMGKTAIFFIVYD